MGVTVRQKRKGPGKPWYIYVHHNKQIISKKIGTKREADNAAAKIRRRLLAGELALPPTQSSPTFGEYVDRYMKEHAQVVCKVNTWTNYQTIIDLHLLPAWKDIPLDQITRQDVKRLLLKKQNEPRHPKRIKKKPKPKPEPESQKKDDSKETKKGRKKKKKELPPPEPPKPLKPASIANIKALISGIFTQACDDGLITANPALRLGKFIRKDTSQRQLRMLTREQVKSVLDAALNADPRDAYPDLYPLFLCAFRTGMRLGELLGLTWDAIDFDANTIEVRRSYSHGHWSTPKSHVSRTIDMSNQLKTTLLQHRDTLKQRHRGHLPIHKAPDGHYGKMHLQLVFPTTEGGTIDGDNLRRRAMPKLIEAANVPAFRIHDIRHTFASLLLAQGEPLHYVKEQMGHASIQTTVDIYGHLIPGSNRNAVNRLDDPDKPDLKLIPADAS